MPWLRAISSANSPMLARLHGQRGWSTITKVARVESCRSVVSLGQRTGEGPRLPGVVSYFDKMRMPPPTANSHRTAQRPVMNRDDLILCRLLSNSGLQLTGLWMRQRSPRPRGGIVNETGHPCPTSGQGTLSQNARSVELNQNYSSAQIIGYRPQEGQPRAPRKQDMSQIKIVLVLDLESKPPNRG